MDRRSWPWKKKSSEKTVPTPVQVSGSSNGTTNGSSRNQDCQDNGKDTVSYIQLTQERHTCLLEMEDQVKLLNEKLKLLGDELSASQSDLTNKDTLIKQHTKVAEEAVSGWEKAEAEALALKNQLESVTLMKLTAEDRAAHLDGALKECLQEIRNVKEESEEKLHDVIFTKTKQWEKTKIDFEAKINAFEQELLRTTAENDAISRSLHERSNMLMRISEQKAQADEEIEVLKTNIQSCEKELSSMKYEVHIVSKELEIRNEEKNMSVRSADVANRQHLEDVKKITKLEAECQRLRGLVRKKLPGPAAVAQMKIEVESLGRDYGDTRLRRSPAKCSSPHRVPATDFSFDNIQHYQKENEFLTARLLAMEEETKMLKEALSKRNSELQASRSMFAKSSSRLRILEHQNQQKSPSKTTFDFPLESSVSHNESNPSVTSMSEDGNDENVSISESWSATLTSDLSHVKKDNIDKTSMAGSCSHLELMDDFLEMERLACLPTEANEVGSVLDGVVTNGIESSKSTSPAHQTKDVSLQMEVQNSLPMPMEKTSPARTPTQEINSNENGFLLSKLQAKIALICEEETKVTKESLLEKIKHLVHELEEDLPRLSVTSSREDVCSLHTPCTPKSSQENIDKTSCIEWKHAFIDDLHKAITQIHDSILLLFGSPNSDLLRKKVGEFSTVKDKVLSSELSLDQFIVILANVLSETNDFGPRIFGIKDNDKDNNSPDCIDKTTLLENIEVQHEHGKDGFLDSSSDKDIIQGQTRPVYGVDDVFTKHSVEEFEQLKLEKDNLAVELVTCSENLEMTRTQLLQTEQHVVDINLELTTCQKSHTLVETQLKCMAESYRTLELRSQQLENEIKTLELKIESIETELQEERRVHQEDLVKYQNLQVELERKNASIPLEAEKEMKTKQELEIAAAAEKLAECQETIFLLGRHLKSLQPNEQNRTIEELSENIPSTSDSNAQAWPLTQISDSSEKECVTSNFQRTGGESPSEGYDRSSPSDVEAGIVTMSPMNSRLPKPRMSKSSSSNPIEDKHGRGGFSRFFSKGKNSV